MLIAVTKKRTSRKKAPHSGKTQQDSEIRRARRAVSAASGGQARGLSAAGDKTEAGADTAGPVLKGLLRAVAGLVGSESAESVSKESQSRKSDESLSTLPCNPLTGLARRHVGRIGRAPADDSLRLDQHSDRVLAKLARTRLGAWLDESESERTTSINPLNRQTDSD